MAAGGGGGDGLNLLNGKILCLLFYEPSTRTSVSFQSAMLRLGGSCIVVADSTSSVQKGEDLSDTVISLSAYSDCIVLRHPEKGSSLQASTVSSVPIINAGDGAGCHPTQALLDLYTIQTELVGIKVNEMQITIVGDLKYGRTTHSLVRLLALFPGKVSIEFCCSY